MNEPSTNRIFPAVAPEQGQDGRALRTTVPSDDGVAAGFQSLSPVASDPGSNTSAPRRFTTGAPEQLGLSPDRHPSEPHLTAPLDGVRISGRAASSLTGADAPNAPDNFTPTGNPVVTHDDDVEAQEKAALCEEFLRLTNVVGLTAREAARELGKSPSTFSGGDSILAKYQAGGVAALRPRRRECGRKPEVDVPGWFIPAAQCFYLKTNRTWSRGSVPEAIRRTISLPACPANLVKRILAATALAQLPECPAALRELVLAREAAGKPLLPERLMRQIAAPEAVVRQSRHATNAGLDYLHAPGTMMWFSDDNGNRQFIRAGDWVEADDATINFPVVIPWTIGGCPCSDKYGVKVGRFQWLVARDVGSRMFLGYTYVVRPRSSYRREDVLALFRAVCRAHGIPRGWRLERGTWESHMVKDAVRLMGSRLWNVHSPHNKPFIEGGFNDLWTKLSVLDGQVGRYRAEMETENEILTACQQGRKDPRDYFPLLASALGAFDTATRELNTQWINSDLYGRWHPEARWTQHMEGNPLAPLAVESDYLFSPFVGEWTIKGMLVGGKVPLFEGMSVPFDFSAEWLPQFHGARVKAFFDPSEPRCSATLVLAQNHGTHRAGEVLGTAMQINEVAGYARLAMGWGDDPASLGRRVRQQAASALRREVRAIMPNGRTAGAVSEQRDGLGSKAVIDNSDSSHAQNTGQVAALDGQRNTRKGADSISPSSTISTDLTAARESVRRFEADNAHLFV